MLLIFKENTMRHLILVFFIIGTVLIFLGCQEESALAPELDQSNQVTNSLAKPAPNLRGTIITYFDVLNVPYFWEGKIDIEGYGEYGLIFETLSGQKGYSQAAPFEEYFIIYELESDWADPENVFLAGHDEGVTTIANKPPEPSKFRMNGEIEVANFPFEGWLGRNVHMSGIIEWANDGTPFPKVAIGTFRIN